jgi:uncharacterized protein
MKTTFILFALVLSLCLPVSAQKISDMPMITVTGTAEIQVVPDEVVFSLDVTKLDMDLQTAKSQAETTISKVRELTRRFAVEPRNVKTDSISVERKYVSIRDPKNKIYDEDGDEIGKKIFKGYEVSTTITVRLTDISRFEEFFAESLKTGITEVNSVKFETSKLREHKDNARDLAMKAAKEKASAMAASVGQTIGKAVIISEAAASNRDYGLNANVTSNTVSLSRSVTENVATFAPGSISIEAQVTVSFLLN